MCTIDQENCVQSIVINNTKCLKECEGMEITSFTEKEAEGFEPGSKLSTMSTSYYYYKSWYKFPSQFKGKNVMKSIVQDLIITEYELRPNLKVVEISFDTPTFDRITKDDAAKPVQMLSAIGGTMGLLTGFSIISAIEIIYFVIKFSFQCFKCNYDFENVNTNKVST